MLKIYVWDNCFTAYYGTDLTVVIAENKEQAIALAKSTYENCTPPPYETIEPEIYDISPKAFTAYRED
jgi:hypothetical protein